MSSSSADLDALSGFRLGEEMGGKIMFPQVLKREVGLGCGRGESVGARIVSIEMGLGLVWAMGPISTRAQNDDAINDGVPCRWKWVARCSRSGGAE